MKKLLTVLLLAFAILFFIVMFKSNKKPEKTVQKKSIPVVSVMSYKSFDYTMKVNGTGTVKPSEIVNLMPQVSGKIIYRSKNMVDGGFFKKNDILYKIDPIEYRLRLAQAEGNLAMQQLKYSTELEEVKIATNEWEKYKVKNPNVEDASSLTLREPQLKLAKANLDAAKAGVDLAKLSLERTIIKAPFSGRVKKKNVDIGQIVGPASNLSILYNTEIVLISVPVKKQDIRWITIPQSSGRRKSTPKAFITADFGGEEFSWFGRLVRDEAELDPRSRMVNLVVEIKNTYSKKAKRDIISGLFVKVEISGNIVKNVFKIPRGLIHNNNEIYIVDNGMLKRKKVHILRTLAEDVIVDSGISNNDKIITSRLDAFVQNSEVRVK